MNVHPQYKIDGERQFKNSHYGQKYPQIVTHMDDWLHCFQGHIQQVTFIQMTGDRQSDKKKSVQYRILSLYPPVKVYCDYWLWLQSTFYLTKKLTYEILHFLKMIFQFGIHCLKVMSIVKEKCCIFLQLKINFFRVFFLSFRRFLHSAMGSSHSSPPAKQIFVVSSQIAEV